MRFIWRLVNVATLVIALAAGCSSSNNSNKDAASGSGPTTKLVDLSRADLNQLCAQESANGTGTVSCGADASVNVTPLGVCTSLTPDCSATVATSQACAATQNADACNADQLFADMKTPACLVMMACTQSLCTDTICFCPDSNTLSTCMTTCKRFTAGLTTDCASCIAGLYGASSCPDFTALPAAYAQCTAICAHGDGG
ncbi:MAG TPA: hypothetical protein VH853_12735 [Polyangia bacterium]|jgi:hypothetical protein|nr:hypothetical protein [Polyangia bacterium]